MLTADEGYAGSSSAGSRRLWPGAAFVPLRAEHEVVDQQLRAAAEVKSRDVVYDVVV